jgi:L-methionine (R)-S-oxide reductase
MSSPPTKLGKERAKELFLQIETLLNSDKDGNVLQKVVQALITVPTYTWAGIYLRQGNNLLLRSWAGPQATVHTQIPIGKGICGWAAKSGKTEIVSDVSKDARYLECFSSTRSEIVVPVLQDGKVVGEIDVDGDILNAYSSVDREFLEAVATKIAPFCKI